MTGVFFNYSLDCELPRNTLYIGGAERQPFVHGPKTWEFGEAAVRGFVRQMEELGARAGASLFVCPDVARHQKGLYRELAAAGVEIAPHLNGLRYSRLTGDKASWLGAMTRADQREALRVGKEDIAHHASRHNNLICGDLNLYEIPIVSGLHVYYDEAIRQPLDLRVETPPERLGENREKLRAVIVEHLVEMDRRQAPVRAIIGGSHTINPFAAMRAEADWVESY